MELLHVIATILLDTIVVYFSLVVKRQTSERFWSLIRKTFWPFYHYVKPGHSGILSTYLLWAVVGFVAIFLATMVVLG